MARLLLVVPLVALGVVLVVFAARELGERSEITQGSDPGPRPGGARTVVVRIKDDRFRPELVSLAAGQSVRWANADDTPHRVMSAGSSDVSFDSGRIPPGEVFEHTFTELGDFPYRGDASGMRGTVTVLGG